MIAVERDMASRLSEIEIYLRFIRELERSPIKTTQKFPSAKQSVTILKASSFLLLYNAVESCVRSAFAQTYSEIGGDGLVFPNSSDHVKKIWLKQQMAVSADSANHQTYLNEATKIARLIADGAVLDLDSRKLPVSGNLDGDQIRELCGKHGINLVVSKWAKGGAELATIKAQRNALAHGHKSFAECGRDYAVKDLERIFKQTKHFLSGFVKSISRFNGKHGYRK